MEERRPSPEAMLARASHEAARAGRGRLKIFFGAVPGVGKTYAMLEAARTARQRGLDVVIGWLETHGRAETAAMAEGFEHLPPRAVAYRGVTLSEFDLDAALERRPALLLVDELPHTNAPGSRHAQRWQDVAELLEAGVSVWTTLNVQHVESLNDVVASITGVSVRETVPDSLIDSADEIELVDLPPDDLLRRLSDGKVYVPAQIAQAAENFFKKGNLIALRELAMRRAAERVEAQAAEWRREHGIAETWRTRERLLVAVDDTPASADLIRACRRMASSLHAPWIAMTVEDPGFVRLPAEDRERLSENLALAQRLGAETLVVGGDDVAAQVLSVARERGVTRLLIGRPRRRPWQRLGRRSRVDQVVRGAGAIDVLVTSGEPEEAAPRRLQSPERRPPGREYLWALVAIAIPTAVCSLTREQLELADQAMIYLLAVLVASSRLSRGPSLLVAVSSIAALDFFFVPPFFTFAVSDLRYLLTFLVMLLVALATSHRTVRMREQADEARARERRTAALHVMSRDLGAADDRTDVAELVVSHVRALFGCDATVLLANDAGQLERAAGGAGVRGGAARERAVAQWVLDHGRPAGRGTDTLPAADSLFLPLVGSGRTLGVFGLDLASGAWEPSPSQHQLLEAFTAQAALALERIALRDEAYRARVAAETERTRSTLLSAVSHDLRTPLASIHGAASFLLDRSAPVTEETRRDLLGTIEDESQRMARLVGNLLDLTRLESGSVEPQRQLCPVDEIVDSALDRMHAVLAGRPVVRELPDEVLEVEADPVLLEQALVNLLDNAAKYTPAGSEIAVGASERANERGGEVVLEVADRGPGLPAGEEQRVFEKFYRAGVAPGVGGAGLGLSIVQSVARLHGGWARAENRPGGGACFSLGIPRVPPGERKP